MLLLVLPVQAQRRISSDATELQGTSGTGFTSVNKERTSDHRGMHRSQYVGEHHAIGLYLTGAYSDLFSGNRQVRSTPGGYMIGAGGLYEYHHGIFALQAGLGATYQEVTVQIEDGEQQTSAIDSWGTPYTLHYAWYNRQDKARNIYFHIPILLGVNINHIYALAGPKVNIALYGNSHAAADISTFRTYDQFIGTWQEMDNHGYRKLIPLEASNGALGLQIDVMAAAEVGYQWFIHGWWLRVGAYADFSMLNISPKGKENALSVPANTPYDFATFRLNPYLAAQETADNQLHNFSAGIKVSFLFSFRQPDKCILCSQKRRH